jgi:regulator of cell morphogenesis and NO signaling
MSLHPPIDTDAPLGELVNQLPGAARTLESYGLDYCCGGRRSLADACATQGVDVDRVVEALASAEPGPWPDWLAMRPAELVGHLESTHHAYLHAELPRLDALAEKVAGVHGARHPELLDLLADVKELRDDLEPHLMKEERVLFPLIRRMGTEGSGHPTMAPDGPIAVMLAEHDLTGALLERIRGRTDGFTPPSDACASYRALFDGLAELEADTHLHVHKENNVLFPAVLELAGST